MASEQQRAFLRKKVAFSFEVTAAERDGAPLVGLQGKRFQGLEISAGGMGFETGLALRRGDQLSVHLQLPGEQQSLRLTMQIVHVAPLPEAKLKGALRAGARFDRMPPQDHSYLSNYIGATLIMY